MDGVWLLIALAYRRVLTRKYFRSVVVPSDPLWGWLGRRIPETALIAFYRGSFFYGTTRFIFWMLWAHVANSFVFDLSWGGPDWVGPVG